MQQWDQNGDLTSSGKSSIVTATLIGEVYNMARYECIECHEQKTGEGDCWEHANEYGHEVFRDDSYGGLYYPLADPDVLAYR